MRFGGRWWFAFDEFQGDGTQGSRLVQGQAVNQAVKVVVLFGCRAHTVSLRRTGDRQEVLPDVSISG